MAVEDRVKRLTNNEIDLEVITLLTERKFPQSVAVWLVGQLRAERLLRDNDIHETEDQLSVEMEKMRREFDQSSDQKE